MASKTCKHNTFRETCEGSSRYRCKNKKCGLVIDMSDSVDIMNGEHDTIKGEYAQLVYYIRKR